MTKEQLHSKIDVLGQKYEATNDQNILDHIEQEYRKYLDKNPFDSETWIELAIFVNAAPLGDYPQAIKYLEQLLVQDNQNIKAILILSDIQDMNCGGISGDVSKRLFAIKTDSHELMSMVEYAKARYCFYEEKNKYEEHLIKSIDLYSKHVNNYKELGKMYIEQGKIKDGCILIKQALKNITCVYPEVWPYLGSIFKINTVDKFIDYFFKGTYTTQGNLEDLGNLYLRHCSSIIKEK